VANPVYKTLNSLDDVDIISNYSNDELNDKGIEMQQYK
jgi:hypothetical protein